MREKNTAREIESRKYRGILTSVGMGTIAFAAWTLVKYVGLWILYKGDIFDFIASSAPEGLSAAEKVLVVNISTGIFAVIMLITVLIQVYVGRSAVKVGRDGKKKWFYLVFAFLMAIGGAISIAAMIFGGSLAADPASESDVFKAFEGSFIVELTLFIMVCDLIHSSFKVRMLSSEGKHSKER